MDWKIVEMLGDWECTAMDEAMVETRVTPVSEHEDSCVTVVERR
jgi:hypothetical protein